jgi:hypothetical protein
MRVLPSAETSTTARFSAIARSMAEPMAGVSASMNAVRWG